MVAPRKVIGFPDLESSRGMHVSIPKRNNGSTYELNGLNVDRKEIAQYILEGVREWIDFSRSGRMDEFKSVHLTVCGVARSGKAR